MPPFVPFICGPFWLAGNVPGGGGMHVMYGIAALFSFPALFVSTRGENSPQTASLYGFVALFLTGSLLRAAVTGA